MTKTCPECEGTGVRIFERVRRQSFTEPYGDIEEYEVTCENCGGLGVIDDDDEEEDQ